MKKNIGFYFNPKQWLGDQAIIAMDWDCRAIHLHFMCIAWQQAKKGYLLNDDKKLRKFVGNPDLIDWNDRIKPQVFGAWKTTIIDEKEYFYLQGLLDSYEELKALNREFKKIAKQNEQHGLEEEKNQSAFDFIEESTSSISSISSDGNKSNISDFDAAMNDSTLSKKHQTNSHNNSKNSFTKKVMPEEISEIASIADISHQQNETNNSAFNLDNLNKIDKSNRPKFSIRRNKQSDEQEVNNSTEIINSTDSTASHLSTSVENKSKVPTLSPEEIRVMEERKVTIWTLGINMLTTPEFGEGKVRGFLGKLVKEHGEANLAKAISQILIKDLRPIEAKSFLMGTLKKIEKDTKKATSRGKVAL